MSTIHQVSCILCGEPCSSEEDLRNHHRSEHSIHKNYLPSFVERSLAGKIVDMAKYEVPYKCSVNEEAKGLDEEYKVFLDSKAKATFQSVFGNLEKNTEWQYYQFAK